MKNLLVLLFFCCSTTFFGQESVLLKGKIKADSLMEGTVHIVNLTRETGVVNEEGGNFEIVVGLADTLFFSSIQFEKEEIIISPEIFEKRELLLQLKPKINELAEVKISNIDLSGNLSRDIAEIKIIDPTELGFAWPKKPLPQSERLLYTASSSPTELLLNMISGRLEMLKKNNENMKRKRLVGRAQDQFSPEFFVSELGIQSPEIVNFLHFCAETIPEFQTLVANEEMLKLVEIYKERAPHFLKMRKGEQLQETSIFSAE